MNFAIVFPGQGSQKVGMLTELAVQYPAVQETFASASKVLGYDLWQMVSRDPDNQLNQTEYTQPAMLTAGIAVWRIWQQLELPKPAYVAGHSLGEYTALVAAGVLTFDAAVSLVAKRARLMQQAIPKDQGGMAAIIGLTDDAVRAICTNIATADNWVEAVNFNSPGQVVIAGHIAAVNSAMEQAKGQAAKMALLLPVSVPAHSRLMKTAAEKLSLAMEKVDWSRPTIPVIHNVDAKTHNDVVAIKIALQQQLYNPVLWVDTIHYMQQQNIQSIFELGPGKVLSGLCKRIDRNIQTTTIDSPDSLNRINQMLELH